VNGDKFVVRETGEKILARIVDFRRRVLNGLPLNFSSWTSSSGAVPRPNGMIQTQRKNKKWIKAAS